MVEFEKTACDPKRLFQSSFRLNEEERFRKTCVPNLLKYEKDIKTRVEEYEKSNRYSQFPLLVLTDS
jgi:hypothetical protein